MSHKPSQTGWAQEEFAACTLKDPRQIKRLGKIAEDMMNQPQASLHAASGDWAASKAAYRFFASPIKADAVLSGHRHKTIERLRGHAVVLAVQDTTALNFTTQRAKRGLGSIGTKSSGAKGFYGHTTLAVDLEGCALGVLDVQSYVRQGPPAKRQRKAEALQRESARWLNSLAHCQQAAHCCGPSTQIIAVADREADFYEFFAYAAQEAPQVGVLVRAKHDRELAGGRLFAQIREQPALGELQIEVPRSAGRKKRPAHLQIRATIVHLQAPAHWRDAAQRPVLELWAIEVWEAAPPKGQPAICWRLLTTRPAKTLAAGVEIVRFYNLRWTIEVWHKILKSGCQVEAHQLRSFERLERVLRLDAIIAWRVLYLMSQGRSHPEQSCAVALEEEQWKALYSFTQKAAPPERPPSLGEAMRWIARLGGFAGRKGDGHPGPQVLWRGLAKLETLAQAWLTFVPPKTCG